MTQRLADRTNSGPDHRHPDDVPLDGIDEDLTAPEPIDLDHLVRFIGPPWTTVTPNGRYL